MCLCVPECLGVCECVARAAKRFKRNPQTMAGAAKVEPVQDQGLPDSPAVHYLSSLPAARVRLPQPEPVPRHGHQHPLYGALACL